MIEPLYEPFKKMDFGSGRCFLSGEKLESGDELMHVFPLWFMQRFGLEDKAIKLLDESISLYKDIKIPCSAKVYAESIAPLELEVETAFSEGYAALKALAEERLFQWIAKLVYGIIYHEIRQGMRQQMAQGEAFNLSEAMAHKFGNLHIMLQSLIRTIVFEERNPWTICLFQVEQEADFFSYRDEINTLSFSLRAADFGIIACLQDNGANGAYHHEILNRLNGEKLKPIQFEEICARCFYSAYLFNRLPEYTIMPTEEGVFIEPMPLQGISAKPIFDHWDNKTYGKVLENFWKPWGYTLFEIIQDPEKPMSFLFDDEGHLRQNLPL